VTNETIVAASVEAGRDPDWFAFNLRLTSDDMRHLTAEQIAAVYGGAQQIAQRLAEVTA
jgi:hypothetical protein